jgi:Family of unknown function (DUF6519)
MRGDFTRDVFDPRKHYSRVLQQQGRVLLDDDWNVQTDIHLHYLRALARDLIGAHGGPVGDLGFEITDLTTGLGPFSISQGHYYVDGILCENDADVGYWEQPAWYRQPKPATGSHLVYLDVWERHVTALQDPLLREVALGGPDTTTRAEVVWQVKAHPLEGAQKLSDADLAKLLEELRGKAPRLMAQAKERDEDMGGPCAVDPESRYRGLENQLYRVEIHRGGTGASTTETTTQAAARGRSRATYSEQQDATEGQATLKWSRDNGAVAVFPVLEGSDHGLVLEHLGRDERSGLAEDQWVELTDDDQEYSGRDGRPLLQVETIDPESNLVTLRGSVGVDVTELQSPLLRRWDQTKANAPLVDGAMPLVEGEWVDLEDGVQVWFEPGGVYRPGMYWLIPARVATGDVEWPQQPAQAGSPAGPALRGPHGIVHHYAPLCQLTLGAAGVTDMVDRWPQFRDLCEVTAKVFT